MSAGTPPVVLAGDIGGTHTRLALYACAGGSGAGLASAPDALGAAGPAPLSRVDLDSVGLAAHHGLEDVVIDFLGHSGHGVPVAIVLACAGPVRDGESRITNLPWTISEASLRARTGAPRVRLVNDFEAMAHGTETLAASELEVLQQGERSPTGARLVLGAGTGLGQAWVVPPLGSEAPPQPPRVFASEGGHQSFAPRDAFEDGLLVWLRARHGRVSVERVVSGLGLVELYHYVAETGAASTSDAMRDAVAQQGAQVIGLYGQGPNGDPACTLAVQRFVSSTVRTLATQPSGSCRRGVVITGGMAAGLLPVLRHAFMPAFLDKGRLRAVLEPLHVAVALPADTGMRGAARLAQALAG